MGNLTPRAVEHDVECGCRTELEWHSPNRDTIRSLDARMTHLAVSVRREAVIVC